MANPHKVTEDFEECVANYTGSKYAVAVDNCSNALFLCLKYLNLEDLEITIPKHTYPSVPCSIINAGHRVRFKDSDPILKGSYRLEPTPIWDSALRFTRGMYIPGQFMCLSFSGPRKHLKLGKGGMILTDSIRAYEWFKKARYSGRNPIDYLADDFTMTGWNFYMSPDIAARGLLLMGCMGDNPDVQQEYPDLSKFSIYTKDKK